MNTNSCNQFDRNNQKHPVDNVYTAKPSHKYHGTVTNSIVTGESGHTPKCIRTIDDAIIVESVDQKTRETAINHFKTSKLEASLVGKQHETEFYKGVAITILGIGIGIGCGPFMPAVLPIIGGIAGATLSILGIRHSINNNSAINTIDSEIGSIEKMTSQWKDPADAIIAQRKQAGIKGFQYVYDNNLKGKVVHQNEVRELWLNDFSKLISGRQSLSQMCQDNLLGEICCSFAWDSPRLPDIEIGNRHFSSAALNILSTQFGACRSSFNDFETTINHEIKALENQKAQLKREIGEVRSRWLYPSECLYAQSKQEADCLYESALNPYKKEKDQAIEMVRKAYRYIPNQPLDQNEIDYKNTLDRKCNEEIRKIESHYNSHPAILNIQRAYERDRRMCTFLYNQSQLVVNSFFDNRLRELENAFKDSKMRIEEQRSAGHTALKETMDKILGNVENPLLYINTTAPAIHRNWRMPQLSHEPSWNEVYGQAPRFQTNFIEDISQLSWDLFWSGQGLGRYSTCPTSSWNTFSQDRSALSFNLHNFQQNAQVGMFAREVIVPKPPFRASAMPQANPVKTPVRVPGVGPQTCEPTSEARGFATSETREPLHVPVGNASQERRRPTATGYATSEAR